MASRSSYSLSVNSFSWVHVFIFTYISCLAYWPISLLNNLCKWYVLYDYKYIKPIWIYRLFIFWSVFNRQYTHFFSKNRIICNSRDLRSRVFIMILTIFIENFNWLVSNNWSISQESMYALIWKGLWTHGFKFFSIFFHPVVH